MNAGPTTPATDSPATASRRRILARTRLDFWLDALLLVAYTLAYSLGFTGIATHEWLGIGLGVLLLVHLTLHWGWVIRTTSKLLRRGGRERFAWLVNQLFLAADARHYGDADADPRAHPRRAGLAVDRGRGPPVRRLASGTVTVRFVRHFTAVVLTVAVIVGLGMLWAHVSGGAGIGSGPRRAPSREALLRLGQIKAGVIRVHSDNGFTSPIPAT
jgi:hypothetical protein